FAWVAIAWAIRMSRQKPARLFIFRWKAGSTRQSKWRAQTAEKFGKKGNRSVRTVFAPSVSIQKEIGSRSIRPRVNVRPMGDPRNVAHAKKVVQEKQHKQKEAA